MKRTSIQLDSIAEYENLLSAFHKASRGKRFRDDVKCFSINLDENLTTLGNAIRKAKLPYGEFRAFRIFDPKERLIHAACFEDRIFHHALMNLAGDTLERAMMPNSYACRPGKGVHRAIAKVQQHLRQYEYYCRIDIDGYFASINQACLQQVLMRRFKGKECEAQLKRILASYESTPGVGLPIGSLTSQYFANYYLDGVDRFLAAQTLVRASVRYMDDIVWWCDCKQDAGSILKAVKSWLERERLLSVKQNVLIQASKQGVTFCGFRVLRGVIRLSRRRKRRFQQRRKYWEWLYLHDKIDAHQLQCAYAAVEAVTAGADSKSWQAENLRRHPAITI